MKLQRILGLFLVTLLCVAFVTSEKDVTEDEEATVEDSQETVTPETPKKEKPRYKAPRAKGNTYFVDPFESVQDFESRWVLSEATKDDTDEAISKYDGKWSVEESDDNPLQGDLGLVLKSKAKHHAISARLSKPYEFNGKPFIVQYEVKFQNGQECGGAYIKLLSEDSTLKLDKFQDKTPYTVMFGPDKCGNDNKLHFIFRHKNPKTGKFEEKHAKKPDKPLDVVFSDKRTHLFTLVVSPDNSFEVFVDQELTNSGNLLENVEPPVNPPAEIIDPKDKKPEDWDEREKIQDPEASKPEDWNEDALENIPDPDAVKPDDWLEDEPKLIADPNSEKPSDWDDDMDGEWEAPQIDNPKCESVSGCGEWKRPQIKNPEYKGKWRAPMISNPAYKGKWKPGKIPNPDFFEDKEPYKMTPIGAVGLELWSMSDNIMFDNFIITDDRNVADEWAKDSFEVKHKEELSGGGSSKSVVDAVKDMTSERPWLWAVFGLVVVLPIVLVIGYCCMGSSKPKADDLAARKKTDEPTPDDEPEEESKEEEQEETATNDGSGDAKSKKTSKGALEAEEENEADAEEEEEEDKEESTGQRRSPRKRKTRKE